VHNGSVAEPSDDARAAALALSRTARMLERALARDTAPTLTLSDYRVLTAVAGGEGRASRLARRLAVGKPSVSASVDSLVRRGLLARRVGAGDQRAIDLTVTPTGHDVLGDADRAIAGLVTDIASRTPDPEGTLAALAAFGTALEQRQGEIAAHRTEPRA